VPDAAGRHSLRRLPDLHERAIKPTFTDHPATSVMRIVTARLRVDREQAGYDTSLYGIGHCHTACRLRSRPH